MKRSLILFLPALLLGCCGCADGGSLYARFREAEELQLVQTLGYDRRAGLTTVTAASGRGSAHMPSTQLRGMGESISAAIENMQELSPQETLFFAHTRFILLGEAAAQAGIEPLLDWFERSTQTRLLLPVFLVEDSTAEALIYGAGTEETEVTQILYSLQREAERLGWAWGFTLCDMARDLASRGCALCCSIRVQELPEEKRLTALCSGFALFRDGRLLCLTGKESARGICLLLNKAGSGTLSLPAGDDGTVTLELLRTEAKLRPEWGEAGAPVLHVALRCRAGIVEDAAEGVLPSLDLQAMEQALSAWLEEHAELALALLRDTGADYLDLESAVERSNPARFAALDWPAALRELEWTVSTESTVERSYDLTQPGSLTGEGQKHG